MSRRETNARLRDPIMVRPTSSGLSTYYYYSFGLFWIIFYPFPIIKLSPFYLITSPVPTCLVHNCEASRRLFYSHLLSLLSQDQIPFDPHQRDYKKKLAEKEIIQTILMVRFGEYTRFRSPRTSHIDFPHQQLMSPFFLPILHVVGKPLEFLVAGIEHVASWSEAEGQLSSSPHRKEEMRAAEKSSSNSCAIVVPWQ